MTLQTIRDCYSIDENFFVKQVALIIGFIIDCVSFFSSEMHSKVSSSTSSHPFLIVLNADRVPFGAVNTGIRNRTLPTYLSIQLDPFC